MAAMTATGEAAMEREVETGAREAAAYAEEALDEVYEIARCADAVVQGGHTRVALQFPDSLLPHAVRVVDALQSRVPAATFVVLGDTSYGSCCVDEVAAEHGAADLIIHYGRSCLSRTTRIPTLYVLGRTPVDIDDAAAQLRQAISASSDFAPSVIALVADTDCCHALPALGAALAGETPAVTVCNVDDIFGMDFALPPVKDGLAAGTVREKAVPAAAEPDTCENADCATAEAKAVREKADCGSAASCACTPATTVVAEPVENTAPRFGRANMPPADNAGTGTAFFYVGDSSSPFLLSLAMTYSNSCIYSYDPIARRARLEDLNVNRKLKRRYFLVQKAKEAKTVGLLAGTLGVANYRDVLYRLKRLLKLADKKCHTFLMGKINPAKLSNFTEVDLYVMVACPETSLVDSREFYRPVITPFELELGCATGREWTGRFETDFRKLLATLDEDLEAPAPDPESEPVFSLVSGSYVTRSVDSAGDNSERAVQSKASGRIVQAGGAARTLAERSFQGLEQQLGETPVVRAVQGRRGIAIGYDEEPQT